MKFRLKNGCQVDVWYEIIKETNPLQIRFHLRGTEIMWIDFNDLGNDFIVLYTSRGNKIERESPFYEQVIDEVRKLRPERK